MHVEDVVPPIYADKILKVGTFKIDAHGTKMGEQFIKIIMDCALCEKVDACYVTIYENINRLSIWCNSLVLNCMEQKEKVKIKKMFI